MRQVLNLVIVSLFALSVFAQEGVKRIAILETVDKAGNISYGTKILLRQSITYAITKTPGYEGYNRVDMAQMLGEHEFQRTGYVSDSQIKRLGKMTGAAYVLIAEAANYDAEHIIILANLVNVETGQIENSSIPVVAGTDPDNMAKSCAYLAEILLNIKSHSPNSTSSKSSTNKPSSAPIQSINPVRSDKNYTETAMGVNMEMVWVDGGEFVMGCSDNDCRQDEMITRNVVLDGFYIGMMEVNQAQWAKIMGTTLNQQKEKTSCSRVYGVGANYPMYYITYDEAMEFCRILSQKTGKHYSLPTEAQWEYAARGGIAPDGTIYAGSDILNNIAWYVKNGFATHPCGEKQANALGIFDMSGNVAEWCKDWYAGDYPNNQINNPQGVSSGTKRVRRGGSWEDAARYCRVSSRGSEYPNIRSYAIGFRVVCIP
jgi:formylglycine-generating enzyme required for sulfatase activity